MRVEAPAKVNLDLSILAREPSGYHQLETLFCALELADELEIEPGGDAVRLEVAGADVGPVEQNLVYRAALAFFEAAGLPAAARIGLTKRIPAGGGLGGGSSDAAATLQALDEHFGAPLGRERLLEVAARLGSDVPFFLCGSALALGWGRGERLLPLPELPRVAVLLAVPPFAIATAEAYRALDEARGERWPAAPCVHQPDAYRTWTALATRARNDFEPVLFPRYSQLARLKASLAEAGAEMALLTGSGSALFGVFRTAALMRSAARDLGSRFPDVRFLETGSAAQHREDLLG